MTDDQPTGSCPTCGRRDPRTPQLCDVDRSKLRAWLFDIPSLYAELAGREYDGIKGAAAGGRVSGSKERRLPIDADAVDLTGPVRSAGVAVLDEDAVGYESVASTLDFWVEDWRAFRGAGERRPSATVPELTRWLLDRLNDAMDVNPAVVEFYDAVRRLRGALQAQLGLIEVPDYKRGIPCPRCAALTLVHHSGADHVECGSCSSLLSFLEYDEHVRALSAVQVQARRQKVASVKAVRRLLEALRGAGWRHTLAHEESEHADDGAPIHHGYRVHRWTRGTERVEVWAYEDAAPVPVAIWYATGEAEAQLALNVGVDWVKANGVGQVQKLARAAGILTPVKQKETAA